MVVNNSKPVIKTPSTRTGRLVVGTLLIIFGLFGFLPVLGFWMIPLGLVILSADFPILRRWRRKATLAIGRWIKRVAPSFYEKWVGPMINGMSTGNGNGQQGKTD